MNDSINNIIQRKKQGIFSVWAIVLLISLLIITLSTIGLQAYQKKSGTPNQPAVKNAQYEILKQQILQQKDVIDTHWLHTLNPLVKKVRGRLLWSTTKQQGIMEFTDLPVLTKNQSFILSIFDLNADTDFPVSAVFDTNNRFKDSKLIIPFTSSEIIKNPFKFELSLKEKGVDSNQQLLLAQP